MKKILILEDDALLRKQLVQLAKEADGENQVFDCDNVGGCLSGSDGEEYRFIFDGHYSGQE